MKSKSKPATQISRTVGTNFLVSIYHQDNHSWQGSIQWLDTGEKLHFRSELEMINLMSRAIQKIEREEEPLRDWSKDLKGNAC